MALETTTLWGKFGFMDFTGAQEQWRLNTLEKQAHQPDVQFGKDLHIDPHAAGKPGSDQALVSMPE